MYKTPNYRWSWEKPPLPIPDVEIIKTIHTDIVIIGAGLAGMVAALSAWEAGARPIIIEKNWTFSARGFHNAAFDSKLHRKMGIEVDYRQVIRDWVRWSQSKVDEVLLWRLNMEQYRIAGNRSPELPGCSRKCLH
jgi:fumarate reductase flavoprotein subunit